MSLNLDELETYQAFLRKLHLKEYWVMSGGCSMAGNNF